MLMTYISTQQASEVAFSRDQALGRKKDKRTFNYFLLRLNCVIHIKTDSRFPTSNLVFIARARNGGK